MGVGSGLRSDVGGLFKGISSFFAVQGVLPASLGVLLLTGLLEHPMGRLFFGPDEKPGFWEGDIFSNECSQRFLDPYSFSHIAHGLIFFFFLWIIAGQIPLSGRYFMALLIET